MPRSFWVYRMRMALERAGTDSFLDVLDRVLDKSFVMDGWSGLLLRTGDNLTAHVTVSIQSEYGRVMNWYPPAERPHDF